MFKMKGLIKKLIQKIQDSIAIWNFIDSYLVGDSYLIKNSHLIKKNSLGYIYPNDFIDGLNNGILIQESLNFPEQKKDSVCYRQTASYKRLFRKREFYYTETKMPITDSDFNFYWNKCLKINSVD